MQLREYTAAGGVVLDGEDRVLLLERWVQRDAGLIHEIRLPKGHVDPGETDEQAALREVCEESGYCSCQVLADLGTSFTEFTNPREHVGRKEHYFLMRVTEGAQRAPEYQDPDEALFRVLWAADLDEAERMLTYESEKQYARRALALRSAWATAPGDD
jgi:8-oxo-dGTP pyrophosphatase MutT (NUDIX family)